MFVRVTNIATFIGKQIHVNDSNCLSTYLEPLRPSGSSSKVLASQVENECFETRFSYLARGLFKPSAQTALTPGLLLLFDRSKDLLDYGRAELATLCEAVSAAVGWVRRCGVEASRASPDRRSKDLGLQPCRYSSAKTSLEFGNGMWF
jgi:hypothetical protein